MESARRTAESLHPQVFAYGGGLIRLAKCVHFFERPHAEIGDTVVAQCSTTAGPCTATRRSTMLRRGSGRGTVEVQMATATIT